jgi:peptide/nickel transport system substrate-binding protein
MNLVRFRHLAVPAVLLAADTVLTGCSPAGDASDGTRIFMTVDEGTPITVGVPMNPFNLTNNTFNGYDVEELGWPTNNPANSNQTLPGLAASWSLSPDSRTLTVPALGPGAYSDFTGLTMDTSRMALRSSGTQRGTRPPTTS